MAESGEFGLQRADALVQGRNGRRDFCFSEARGDVLRAIPVVACNRNDECALNRGAVVGMMQLLHQLRILAGLHQPHAAR